MKLATLTATLALATLTTATHAISLAPGQTLTPDLLTLDPNELDLYFYQNGIPGGGAVPLPFPGFGGGGLVRLPYINTVTKTFAFNWDMGYDGTAPLQSITFVGYQGYSLDAGYLAGTTLIPTTVSRSLDGDTITYEFNTSATSGTVNLFMRTDATDVASGGASLLFVGPTTFQNPFPLPADAPATAPVPELSSLSLLTVATAGFAFRFRRRVR